MSIAIEAEWSIDQDPILPYSSSFPCEEYMPTFQTTLPVVIGSDRTGVWVTPGPPQVGMAVQRFETSKFMRGVDDKVICACAGGPFSMTVARDVAAQAPSFLNLSELEWERKLQEIAAAVQRPRQAAPMDEITVVRRDRSDAWLVSKYEGTAAAVQKMTAQFCTGDNSSARFLPQHLWKRTHPVSRLEVLARLTLRYGSLGNPSGVGIGFDILTIRQGQVSWKSFTVDGFERPFTNRLNEVLEAMPEI